MGLADRFSPTNGCFLSGVVSVTAASLTRVASLWRLDGAPPSIAVTINRLAGQGRGPASLFIRPTLAASAGSTLSR